VLEIILIRSHLVGGLHTLSALIETSVAVAFYYDVTCKNERTKEVYLPMNGVNNDWFSVEAEAHQSWPPKKELTN